MIFESLAVRKHAWILGGFEGCQVKSGKTLGFSRRRAYYHYMLTLFSNRSSRHTIQKPSRLWVFAVKNRAAPRRVRILASFKDFPYFLHICKNRSWHSSAKPQCFARFILAYFKTAQYPCMFARSQTFKKYRFCSRPHHNLASFKNNQFPIAAAQRPRPKAQRQKILKNLSVTLPRAMDGEILDRVGTPSIGMR